MKRAQWAQTGSSQSTSSPSLDPLLSFPVPGLLFQHRSQTGPRSRRPWSRRSEPNALGWASPRPGGHGLKAPLQGAGSDGPRHQGPDPLSNPAEQGGVGGTPLGEPRTTGVWSTSATGATREGRALHRRNVRGSTTSLISLPSSSGGSSICCPHLDQKSQNSSPWRPLGRGRVEAVQQISSHGWGPTALPTSRTTGKGGPGHLARRT